MTLRVWSPMVHSALTIGLLFLASTPMQAAEEGPRCNLATLKGSYGLHVSGTRPTPDGSGKLEEHAILAVRTYDGKGGVSGLGIVSNGKITGVQEGLPTSGTYEVYPNCTGKVTINIPVPGMPTTLSAAFVIVNQGKEVKEVALTPGNVGLAILTKQ